jgi:hypothetical protein
MLQDYKHNDTAREQLGVANTEEDIEKYTRQWGVKCGKDRR